MRLDVASLDCLMLSPRPDDLVRFKLLQGLDVRSLQSRFGVLKYLNRLVTPLLNYVDIAVVTDSSPKVSSGGKKSSLLLTGTCEKEIFHVLFHGIDRRVHFELV